MPSLLERLLGEDSPGEQVDLEQRQSDANDALQNRVNVDAHDIDAAAVTGVAVVNEGPEGEPIVVPIARFSLGEDVEDPDMNLIWTVVPTAVRVLHDTFGDVFVRHYDVQFTFDGDELFEAEECRRVAIPPEYAEQLVGDPSFDGAALRGRLRAEHDIDDEIAPVAWGECKDYTNRNNAAVVTGGTAAAVAVSGSAASCAGAAGGAAGGGAC
jgi:hypothetical protein